MKIEIFQQRLRLGKGVHRNYRTDGKTGIVSIWRHEDKFVLTWEEFPSGEVYNKQNYTRDEVHHFNDIEEVLEFLRINKVNPRGFEP